MPSMVWIAYSTVEWKIVTLSMLQITTFKMLYIERALKSLIKMEYISLERLCECELDWECWRFLVFWFNTEIRQEICNLTFVGFAVNLAHRNINFYVWWVETTPFYIYNSLRLRRKQNIFWCRNILKERKRNIKGKTPCPSITTWKRSWSV